MVLNDTLANALSKIRQYEGLGKEDCAITPTSKIISEVLSLFKRFGYIKEFTKSNETGKEIITVKLGGMINKCGVIKPRFSVKTLEFEKYEKRFLPSKNMGILIVSTTEGMMDHAAAKEKKIGGKLVAYCY